MHGRLEQCALVCCSESVMATKVASRTVTVAMAIAGRGARLCDVCAGKSASWYCGADAAYLCDRCDTQVHSANSLSLRHERVCLTPSGTPRKHTTASPPPRKRSMSKILDASPIPHVLPSRKRSRTTRPHPHHRRQQLQEQVQQLLKPPNPEPEHTILPKQSCEPEDHHQLLTFDDLFDTEDFLAADDTQEVPSLISGSSSYSSSFDIFSPDFHAVSSPSEDSNLAVFFKGKAAHDDDVASEHFLVPVHETDSGIDPLSCDTDGGITLPGEVCFIPGDIPDLTGFEDFGTRELGSLSFDLELPSDETGGESSLKANVESKTESDRFENGPFAKYYAARPKPETMAQQLSPEEIKCEAKEILRCCREGQDPRSWPGLQLNYDDIVTAWADRGEPWVHPDGLVPSSSSGEDDAGREARVLRYKEKRRNRLFSKTIRYEVRKVNAERRPRMKGRFVKRNNQSR